MLERVHTSEDLGTQIRFQIVPGRMDRTKYIKDKLKTE